MIEPIGTVERGGTVGCRIPKAAAFVIFEEVERHVGHVLRCSRDKTVVAGYVVETVALRCEDCGDVLVEGTQRVRVKRSRP
jgi:hypothetical protein